MTCKTDECWYCGKPAGQGTDRAMIDISITLPDGRDSVAYRFCPEHMGQFIRQNGPISTQQQVMDLLLEPTGWKDY